MSRKKSTATAGSAHENQPGDLSAGVKSLKIQVEALNSRIEVLCQVLDEIREDFQWALRNDSFRRSGAVEFRPIVQVTSMPKDPSQRELW